MEKNKSIAQLITQSYETDRKTKMKVHNTNSTTIL